MIPILIRFKLALLLRLLSVPLPLQKRGHSVTQLHQNRSGPGSPGGQPAWGGGSDQSWVALPCFSFHKLSDKAQVRNPAQTSQRSGV